MRRVLFLALLTLISFRNHADAEIWNCIVERKIDAQRTFSEADIERFKPRAVLVLSDAGALIGRCSISISAGNKDTCDYYDADKLELDPFVGIIKAYYFSGQMDLQIYPNPDRNGGRFIENNGRGSISFGTCVVS